MTKLGNILNDSFLSSIFFSLVPLFFFTLFDFVLESTFSTRYVYDAFDAKVFAFFFRRYQ